MKPHLHAESSVRKHGGTVQDYIPIHDFLDQTKAHVPDMRHRAILHNSFGIYLAERFFGTYLYNSDGEKVAIRDLCEEHVLEDMGTIPTLQDYLQGMPLYDWLGGPKRRHRSISMKEEADEGNADAGNSGGVQ